RRSGRLFMGSPGEGPFGGPIGKVSPFLGSPILGVTRPFPSRALSLPGGGRRRPDRWMSPGRGSAGRPAPASPGAPPPGPRGGRWSRWGRRRGAPLGPPTVVPDPASEARGSGEVAGAAAARRDDAGGDVGGADGGLAGAGSVAARDALRIG